jgi:Leucine-rich repeat (LRR) protein
MTKYTLTLDNLNDPIPIETTVLLCSGLKLQELPESIGNLIHLHELNCNSNQLEQLPKWIGNLINLRGLSCNHNKLQELPESIGNLIHLQYSYCGRNPFKKEFNDIISKYPIYNNKSQEMLQELRDAYLISIDNSYVLK